MNNSLPRRIGFLEPAKTKIPGIEFQLVSNFQFMGRANPVENSPTLEGLIAKIKLRRDTKGNFENAYHVRQLDGFSEPLVMPLPQVMYAYAQAIYDGTTPPAYLSDIK